MHWILVFLLAVAGMGVGFAFGFSILHLVQLFFNDAIRQAVNGSVVPAYITIIIIISVGGAVAGGFLGYKLGKKIR